MQTSAMPDFEPLQLEERYLDVYSQGGIDPSIKLLAGHILRRSILDLDTIRFRDDVLFWLSFDEYNFFSFRLVCDILGLDAWLIRRCVSAYVMKQAPKR